MAVGSNAFYTQQYASAVELLAQQRIPRIAGTFAQMTATGKAATVVDFINPFEADERTSLYDKIVFGDVGHTRPWVFPRNFDKAVPFDSIEAMQMNANPESSYVQGVVAALNRQADIEAIRAFFAARQVGEDATTTSENFDPNSTNTVGVSIGGTTSNLNVEKLQQVLNLARKLEVGIDEGEMLNIAITPSQEQSLMNEIEVISADFTSKRIMDSGTMVGSGYMGFNWIISNKLLTDGSGYRRIPVWAKAGMAFCTWNGGISTKVSQREDLRGQPWQVYGQEHCGSVRRDNNRVFEIKCSES